MFFGWPSKGANEIKSLDGNIQGPAPLFGDPVNPGGFIKVLLVATNREASPYPVAPIGALCIASAVQNAGHRVAFLDLGPETDPQSALTRAIKSGSPDVVAFSIRNLDNCSMLAPRSYCDEIQVLADLVRNSFDGALVLGGSGFSVSPRGWMARLQADYGVIGEGERPFVELLARMENKQPIEDVTGVVTQASSNVKLKSIAAGGTSTDSLGTLPAPAHELCDYQEYLQRGGFISVQTKRGCPFKCVYCIYPHLEGRHYRLRPADRVADEIQSVARKTGSDHFFFVDSAFNDPREHALNICAELRRHRTSARWMAYCNPVGFDDELAQVMVEAGCEGVELGLDAATPKMLAANCKPFDQQDIRIAMKAAHDARLPFAAHLLFGGPGETWADIEEAQEFLDTCPPANGIFASFGIRVYEGTAMEEIAIRDGTIPSGHDLFEPAFYVSPALKDNAAEKLQNVVRRRPEWTSIIDWNSPLMRLIQEEMNRRNIRPQWKDIREYGLRMRR